MTCVSLTKAVESARVQCRKIERCIEVIAVPPADSERKTRGDARVTRSSNLGRYCFWRSPDRTHRRSAQGGINHFLNPTERSAVSTSMFLCSERAKRHDISIAVYQNCGCHRVFDSPNSESCGDPPSTNDQFGGTDDSL